MTKDREENALIDLFEREPMEALAFLDAHERWMRNPLNRIWFYFIYYRHTVLRWLGWR